MEAMVECATTESSDARMVVRIECRTPASGYCERRALMPRQYWHAAKVHGCPDTKDYLYSAA